MRNVFIIGTLLFTATISQAQNLIHWDGNYRLQLPDFQSKSTQIGGVNMYSLYSSASMSFSFSMSNYEFMFTKNFNSKVNCTFNRDAASLIAPDEDTAESLVKFAQYEFDLAELHARKFRKKLYDGKGAFSSASFFQPIYNDLQKEYVERHANAAKETDIGRNEVELAALENEVLREIEGLSDFCKTCKPAKRKKGK